MFKSFVLGPSYSLRFTLEEQKQNKKTKIIGLVCHEVVEDDYC